MREMVRREHRYRHMRRPRQSARLIALDVPFTDEDLFGADEAFLTSTTRELVPVTAPSTIAQLAAAVQAP